MELKQLRLMCGSQQLKNESSSVINLLNSSDSSFPAGHKAVTGWTFVRLKVQLLLLFQFFNFFYSVHRLFYCDLL